MVRSQIQALWVYLDRRCIKFFYFLCMGNAWMVSSPQVPAALPCCVQVSGEITYNGKTFDQFIPERSAAYISQVIIE